MAAAPDPKGILVFTFQHNEDDTINVEQVETVVRAEVIFRFATAATVLDTTQMFAPTIGLRSQI